MPNHLHYGDKLKMQPAIGSNKVRAPDGAPFP
jgi:hypothetical protein